MECSAMRVLGIDIGTTSLKCMVTEQEHENIRIVKGITQPYEMNFPGVQSVSHILSTFFHALKFIAEEVSSITHICVCGQMHGIVWWCSTVLSHAAKTLFANECDGKWPWSDLITWEDTRCSNEFLRECNSHFECQNDKISKLASGYGIASFAHILRFQSDFLLTHRYDTCGTIMDLITSLLCGHNSPNLTFIDTINATAWGGFDVKEMRWNEKFLNALDIPLYVLPKIKKYGDVVGTSVAAFGVPKDAKVLVGMGDHPCAVAAAAYSLKREIVANVTTINIGTSAQIAFIISESQIENVRNQISELFEMRPFFNNCFMGVAASLSGYVLYPFSVKMLTGNRGNVLAWFLAQVSAWNDTLNNERNTFSMRELIAFGMEKRYTTLTCSPTVFGERSNFCLHGSFTNIRADNFNIGDMMAALCCGLVDHLIHMIPPTLRQLALSQSVIGTGNALLRNELLQFYLEERIGEYFQKIDETVNERFDAVFGATLIAMFVSPVPKKCQ